MTTAKPDTPFMHFWDAMNRANREAGYPDIMFGPATELWAATKQAAQAAAMTAAIAALPEPPEPRWFDRERPLSERFA